MVELREPITRIPGALDHYGLSLVDDGHRLVYTYDTQKERKGITALLGDLHQAGIHFKDLSTEQSSLEEIFVNLVEQSQ